MLSALARSVAVTCGNAYKPEMPASTSAGGLIAYGTDTVEVYRLTGGYAGRILRGDKPADLPVLLPTKFEMIGGINLGGSQMIVRNDALARMSDKSQKPIVMGSITVPRCPSQTLAHKR